MQMYAPPALLQRIGRLLRAKESLVFYAIGLGLLDFAAPLATGWLFAHRSLATLMHTDNSVAGDAVAGHTLAVIAVALAYLLLSAFFTAGYLRSLLGACTGDRATCASSRGSLPSSPCRPPSRGGSARR